MISLETQTAPDTCANLERWLSWLEYLHPNEIELGLERVRTVATQARLFESLPNIIIVAGTNGKGSVVSLLSSIYQQAGYRVGAYTSPHLIHFNERIKINSMPSSDEDIVTALASIESVRHDVSLTYFEYTTLAAMQVFKSDGVDVAILEVGLGGRLDAVNIWDSCCAIITSVDLDHEGWLGDTREQIATEKVAVARPDTPLIVAETNPPATIPEYARSEQVLYWQVNRDYHYTSVEQGLQLDLRGFRRLVPFPALSGEHQLGNAAAAVAAVESVQTLMPVSAESLAAGIRSAALAGRFEQRRFQNVDLVLDVAHNPAAAKALAASLDQLMPERQIHAVFAVMADKNLDGILSALGTRISSWHLGRLNVARALQPESLAESITRFYGQSDVTQYPDITQALDGALKQASSKLTASEVKASKVIKRHADATTEVKQPMVLVFGSFFTVSEVVELWD